MRWDVSAPNRKWGIVRAGVAILPLFLKYFMKKIAAVIGLGCNELKIPLLIFPSLEEAKSFCEKTFAVPATTYPDKLGEFYYNIDRLLEDEKYHPFLFKDFYYGGCGECYALLVKEIEFGKPFVDWDLD